MDSRLWLSEEPCYGHDPEYGVTPSKKRRKRTLKRGQTSLFLALVVFGLVCLRMAHTASTGASFASWTAGFILSIVMALVVFTHDGHRPHRRGRYGTYD